MELSDSLIRKAFFLQEKKGRSLKKCYKKLHIEEKIVSNIKKPEWNVTAMVDVVEPIGSEAYVYLTTGSSAFVAALDSHEKMKVAEKGEVVFDMEKVHFFDKDTEVVII